MGAAGLALAEGRGSRASPACGTRQQHQAGLLLGEGAIAAGRGKMLF